MVIIMKFTVSEEYDGKPLLDFIRTGCGVSRSALIRLKKLPCGITLNGQHATVRAVLKNGDLVELKIEDEADEVNPYVEAKGEMPEILYEDEAVIAVNKPPFMPTHTSYLHKDDALSNAVCLYMSSKGEPFVFRAVNRLDRDTSGVVLIAKNRFYSCKLSRSLENGEFKKVYLALLDGSVSESGSVKGYIRRKGESIIERVFEKTYSDGADFSHTEYKSILNTEQNSLVAAFPITGRTHQLRLHFASLGAPICGDSMYGKENTLINRHALHAYSLSFPSPLDNKIITVKAPVPNDFLCAAEEMNLHINEEILKNIQFDERKEN